MTTTNICYAMTAIWIAISIIKGDMHEAWAPAMIISQVWLVGAFVAKELRK